MKLILRACQILSIMLTLIACSAAERLPADLQMPVGLETAQNYELACPIINAEQAARAALRLAQKDGALVRAGAWRWPWGCRQLFEGCVPLAARFCLA